MFLTDLEVRKVANLPRARWELLEPLVYRRGVGSPVFVVPAGFVTDFASVPRVPLAFLLAGDKAHQAAVLHDWLYTSQELSREEADQVFYEAIRAMGHSRSLARLMKLGVRVGGGSSYGERARPDGWPFPADATHPGMREAP